MYQYHLTLVVNNAKHCVYAYLLMNSFLLKSKWSVGVWCFILSGSSVMQHTVLDMNVANYILFSAVDFPKMA